MQTCCQITLTTCFVYLYLYSYVYFIVYVCIYVYVYNRAAGSVGGLLDPSCPVIRYHQNLHSFIQSFTHSLRFTQQRPHNVKQ